MTLRTDLSTLLLVDNATAITAAPTNNLANTIADKYDAHVSGAADNHATAAITDASFAGTVAIADTATTTFTRLRQIMSGMIALSGVATSSFATAMGSLPTTLTAVNATLAAATNANTVSTLMKRDGNGDFAARDATLRNLTLSGTFTGSVPTTQLTGALAAAQMPVLTGDVTTPGASLAATVAAVGGKTASAVAQSVTDTVAATSANTFSTLVKRGAAGQVTVGALVADSLTLANGANVTGGETVTGNLTVNGNFSFTGTFTGAVNVGSAVGTLPATSHPALTGDVTGSAGSTATTVAFVGTKSAAAVAQAVVDTIAATNLATASTLMKRDTNADYVARDAALRNVVASGTITGAVATTNLTGALLAAQFPALTGDVTTVAGALAATVAFVGTKSAAAVAQSVADTLAATSANTVGTLVKRDGSGNFSAGTITATIVGNLTGNVAGYASGVNGLPLGGLLVGGGIGSPATTIVGTVVNQVPLWTGTTWSAGAVTVPDGAITPAKFAPGYVYPDSPASLTVNVLPLYKFNNAGIPVSYTGGQVDLSGHIPGPGLRRYVLLEINSTGALFVKDGTVTSGTATVNSITADPDTSPLAFVYLEYGKTQIAAIDILDWRSPAAGNISGTTGSPVGHLHGVGNEARVKRVGLDEFFAMQESPTAPSMKVAIAAGLYRDGSNAMQPYAGGLTAAFVAPAATNIRIDGIGVDNTGATIVVAGTASASPNRPAFANNVKPLAYVHIPYTATVIKQQDDGTNGWIEDIRDWVGFGTTTTTLATVAGGGTGNTTFTAGILVSPGGTGAFTTIAAPASAVVGLTDVQTLTNKTLTNPAISNPTLATGATFGGTFAGAHTYSGAVTHTGDLIAAKIGTASGTGQLTIPAATSDTIATLALAQTLTNKTLTAPAITNPAITGGGSLSGTFSGAHTLSGLVTLSGGATINGTTTLGSLAGILFGTAGAVSAVNVTSGNLLVAGGTGVPTGLAPVNGSLLGATGGAAAYRTPAQARGDLVLNVWPVLAAWDQKPPASGSAGNIQYFPIPASMTLQQTPASGLAHIAIVGASPTGSTQTFNLTKRAAGGGLGTVGAVGTVTVTVGGVVTITVNTTTFVAGDELQISAPATQNTTMTNIRLQFILDY